MTAPEILPQLTDPYVLLASWFGIGFLPFAQAWVAVATVWPLVGLGLGRSRLYLLVAAIVFSLVGLYVSDSWEVELAIKDDGRIVIDEIAGYLAGLAIVGPVGWVGAGLFAILMLTLDGFKPWPISLTESWPGGIGIVGDDVAAGLVAGVAVWLVMRIRARVAA
jgi:phosphatidylglycerophosphatase A